MTLLMENCEKWALIHPKEARLLPLLEPEAAPTPQRFHFSTPQSPVVYVVGIGTGEPFLAFQDWLNQSPQHLLILLDNDPNALYHLLSTEIGTAILDHPQVSLNFVPSPEDPGKTLETLYWQTVGSVPEVYNTDKDPDLFDAFRQKILYDSNVKNALVDEYWQGGVSFFRNFYPNVRKMAEASNGTALFDQFKGVPAIICGAGPSLTKQIPFLKTLADKAVIIAGGSALNALQAAGVKPHFGAGIDPNSAQLERLKETHGADLPFFYRNRLFAQALDEVKGPRLYIPGCGGYDVADWIDERLGFSGEFIDEGHNVVNFSLEIASRLGCSPLILVGVDLAYTDNQHYAQGIPQTALPFDVLMRTDIHGEPIKTEWKWVAEAEWISDFSQTHTVFNATEGGMPIPAVTNIPLQEIKWRKTYPIAEKIQKALLPMPANTSRIVYQSLQELHASLKKVIPLLDQLGVLDPSSGHFALAESDLFDEVAYKHILEMFHQVFERVINRRVLALKLLEGSALAEAKKALQQQKLAFLKKTAQLNLTILQWSLGSA